MSKLTERELEVAKIIEGSSIEDLQVDGATARLLAYGTDGVTLEKQKLIESANLFANVAYKVRNNAASDHSKSKATVVDVKHRHGADSEAYETASKKFDETKQAVDTAELKFGLLGAVKKNVNQASTVGMTF